MSSTNQQIKHAALRRLGEIPEDKAERNTMARAIWDEVNVLFREREDAQWSGDAGRLERLKYQIMVKRTMFKILSRNGVR